MLPDVTDYVKVKFLTIYVALVGLKIELRNENKSVKWILTKLLQ
jgi:hypothetical protein